MENNKPVKDPYRSALKKKAMAYMPKNYEDVASQKQILAMIIACTVLEITIMWYYGVGAVAMGFFVSYAAMYGFDKFKEAWDKVKKNISE